MHVFRVIHTYKVTPGPRKHFSCNVQTKSWSMTQLQDCISGLNGAVQRSHFLHHLIFVFEELTNQPSSHGSCWPTQLLR